MRNIGFDEEDTLVGKKPSVIKIFGNRRFKFDDKKTFCERISLKILMTKDFKSNLIW